MVQPESSSLSSEIQSIIKAGILAPSADNAHTFQVRVSQRHIDLETRGAYPGGQHHLRVLSLISFGAVVENMILRAARLGFETKVAWLPNPSQESLIVALDFVEGTPAQSELEEAIATRCTNRHLLFRGPPLDTGALKSLSQLAQIEDGVNLLWFTGSRQRRQLLRLVRIAETERFRNAALHAELFRAIRFDVGWRAGADEGLPPATLGVEPGLRWIFSQLRHWRIMSALNLIGFHHMLGVRAALLPCGFAPHVGALLTNLPVEQGAPRVGRALERVWLKAESLGLAFQPLAASAILALPAYRDVRPECGERLRRGWRELTGQTPLMVFRLGRAPRPKIHAGRRPLADYVVAS